MEGYKEISTPVSRIWIDESGIVHTIYTDYSDVDIAIARQEIENIRKLSKGKRMPCVVDITRIKSVSREAREYYASEDSYDVFTAVALLVNSPLTLVLANFFLGINKPIMPVKIFTSEERALKWLKNYKRC
jgi:hypothetical protein